MIKAENVNYIYQQGMPFERQALYDVNIEIKDGSLVALIGHTGSGKSTLIQHFNALVKPTSGKIIINGIDVTAPKADLRLVRKTVGLVFQYPEHQLFEETVYKDIAFGPKNMGFSDEEIDKMVKEAEANREQDNKRKEEAEVKNEAEQMIFQTEKSMKDLGEKLDSKDKEEAESKVKTLKEALEKNDIEAIKKEKDALQETLYKLAAKVYENTNASNNTTTEEKTEDKKDDSVKDAEFEEK